MARPGLLPALCRAGLGVTDSPDWGGWPCRFWRTNNTVRGRWHSPHAIQFGADSIAETARTPCRGRSGRWTLYALRVRANGWSYWGDRDFLCTMPCRRTDGPVQSGLDYSRSVPCGFGRTDGLFWEDATSSTNCHASSDGRMVLFGPMPLSNSGPIARLGLPAHRAVLVRADGRSGSGESGLPALHALWVRADGRPAS